MRLSPQKIDRLSLCACVAAGAAYYWHFRDSVDLDAVSYLDIADAYRQHDWVHAVNVYWSPLYSWVIAGVAAILRPGPRWDMLLLALISFVSYCLALLAFRWFWREMSPAIDPLKSIVGYTLFLWGMLLIVVTWGHLLADVGVAAILFLTAAQYIRIRRNPRVLYGALLGATLGIGYLLKAALFPLGLLFLAMCLFERRLRKPAAVAFLTLLVCAAPWIAVVSLRQHRLTFSEAGRLNYAWCADRVEDSMCSDDHFVGWYGDSDQSGYPLHPPALVHTAPRVMDYSPIHGTYPPYYDPSWWYEGIHAYFSPRGQLLDLKLNLHFIIDLIFGSGTEAGPSGILLAGCIGLAMARERRFRPAYPLLLLWCIAAITMYAFVWLEWRYVAGFAVIFWAVLYSQLWEESKAEVRAAVGAVVTTVLLGYLLIPIPVYTVKAAHDFATGRIFPLDYEIARELASLGIRPGDRAALIGSDTTIVVARLGRFRFVSELKDEDHAMFWSLNEQQQEEVFRAMASTGASAVLSDEVPIDQRSRWRCVQGTKYCMRLLDRLRGN